MIKRLIIWILCIIFIVFISATIAISLYGKKMALNLIEQNLKVKSKLENISLGFPFTVNLINLEVGDVFKSERISLEPNPLGFLAGRLVINRLTLSKPFFNLEQNQDGTLNLPKFSSQGKAPSVFLTGLVIKDGRFIFTSTLKSLAWGFTDKKLSPAGYKIILDKINCSISKVMFPPTSLNTKFRFHTTIADSNLRTIGSANGSGWIDFGQKNMDATLEIRDTDVTYFSPYYGNFISNKKLLSARLNLASVFKAENNDLTVSSKLKLSDLVYAKEEQPKEGEVPDIFKNTLDLFTDKTGNLELDFAIKTKLDKPEISVSQLKKIVLNAAAKNLSNQPPEALIEKVTTNIEQFKDFGKELKKIFKKKE